MPTQTPTVPADATPSYPACVEHGVWIPVPVAAPGDSQHLKLKDIDDHESHAIRERGVLTFHAVGCSGDFKEHLRIRLSIFRRYRILLPSTWTNTRLFDLDTREAVRNES
jgi:hypothetical protein